MSVATIKTLDQIVGELPDNTSRAIAPLDVRELALSTWGALMDRDPTIYDDSINSGGAGFFDSGSRWMNVVDRTYWFCFGGTAFAAVWWQVVFFEALPGSTVVAGTSPISVVFDGGSNTYTVSLDSPLSVGYIPDLPASIITSGTLDEARIPDLPASIITSGTLDEARIPDLPASIITSGTLDEARIPDLPASIITSGTLDEARIPNLPASIITAGTFGGGVDLPADQLSAGTVPVGVDLPADQLSAGTVPIGVDLPADQLSAGTVPVGVVVPWTNLSGVPPIPTAPSEEPGVAAAGTTQGTATPVTGQSVRVISGNNTTDQGIILPAETAAQIVIENAAAFFLRVYPPSGEQIATVGLNSPDLMGASSAKLYCRGADNGSGVHLWRWVQLA